MTSADPNPASAAAFRAPNPKRWLILAATGLGTIMSPLDASVVNIAMPTVSSYFHTGLTVVEWVATAYLLVISSLLLTYGRAGDMYGHRRVYMTGFAVFTASSALCALSPTVGTLIAFRVVQALGAGMMMAAGPAIVTAAFPANERGRALGINGMMVAVGLALGPVLGGALIKAFGWRYIFLVNLPIGVIGLVSAARVIPVDKLSGFARKFDVPGAVSAFGALFPWLLALSQGEAWGWASVPVLVLFAFGALSLAAFIWLEGKVKDPMVDLSLFGDINFTSANATALLNFMAQASVAFLIPFYLQQVLGLAPNRAGLLLLASPLVVLVAAPLSGALSDRIGSRGLSSAGMFVISVALFALSRLTAHSAPASVVWRLALIGLGSGVFQSPNNSVIMGSVPRSKLGLASGMLATMRNVGMVLGIAASSAIFTARYAQHIHALARPEAFSASVSDAFAVGAMLGLLGCLTALVRSSGKSASAEGA